MGEIVLGSMASMLICLFLAPRFIAFLRNREFGQNIREEGPVGHQTKAGTPTMGGLIIFAAVVVPFLILSDHSVAAMTVFFIALGCAAIGFADDFIKIVKRRSLGLSARYKLLAQVGLALILWWVARHDAGLEPVILIRGLDLSFDIGPVAYFILVFLVIAGATNGVNLTDGLDGLAAGSSAIVLMTYTAITYITVGPAGSGSAGGLSGRCLRRLPLVQCLPGIDLHGGHRLARARRGDRGAGGHDPD